MKETDFHAWLSETVPPARDASIGIGDDAAILTTGGRVAVATDILVEGVHYKPEDVSPREIGVKAVNRNFSDMAAMGVEPRWILVSAAVPENRGDQFVQELFRGVMDACQPFHVGIVGGDTSCSLGGLVVDVAVIGKVKEGLAPVLRSGARSKDRILVTGSLGGSLLGKHLHFVPRVAEGLFLNWHYRPSSMIDISDGLALDLWRVLDASNKGAVLEGDRIPLSDAAREQADRTGSSPLDHALSDGEDFELLFTLPPVRAQALMSDPALFFPVTDVGEILADRNTRILRKDDVDHPLQKEGYDHRL